MKPETLLAFLLLCAAAPGQQTTISYHRVPREILDERLKMVEPKPAERYARLKGLFEQVGCKGEFLTEMPVSDQKLPNLICDLPGSEADTVIVSAHHDLADVGTGAFDNWSGSALLPALYESLSKAPRRRTFRFVAFTAEETGLNGSKHYVKLMKKKKLARPFAHVNIDSIGAAKTEYWIGHAHPVLANRLMLAALREDAPIGPMKASEVYSDDTEPFRKAKIPTICITSITSQNIQHLHSSRDTLALLNLDD